MQKKINIIYTFLLFAFMANGQVDVSAELDSYKMLVADQRPLHLLVHLSPGAAIKSVDLSGLTKDKEFEMIREEKWDTIQTGGNTILKKDIIFQYFDVGEFTIPKIPVTYTLNGRQTVAYSQAVPITILPVQTQDSLVMLMPIKDIIQEPFTWEDALPWALGGLAFLLLGGSGYWYYKRKQNEALPEPIPVPIPAHETALSKLDELKKEKLWQQGQVKEYQTRLTYIVREYLENRYEVQALESTTDQILRDLKHLNFSSELKGKLREMLQLADMVKFAKAQPPVEIHERLMKDAEEFVVTTKERLVVQEEAGGA